MHLYNRKREYDYFAWLTNQRRLSVDYERSVKVSEAMIQLAMIRIMIRRL